MEKYYVKNANQILSLFIFLILISIAELIAQNKEKTNSLRVTSPSASIQYSKFNINNISTYIYNTGESDQSLTGDSGFQFPIGSGHTVVYKSGLLWGALVNGKIFSGGSSYLTGLTPGRIMENGIADDPNSPNVRVYKVRRDYKTSSLTKESSDEGKTIQEVFNQYEKDWNEWPANYGAPFEDKNLDGKYNPQIDIPGANGADQTLWFIANDLDSTNTKKLYGSLPMGIEMQVTVWGYNQSGTAGNVLYKRYKIINKSKNNFNEMYFGIWSDPDLGGDAGDDLVGCDTLLNLGYVFNSDDSDPGYGNIIPSMGFSLLQGPIVNGMVTDKAYFNNKIINCKKNLSITAFSWLYKQSPHEYGDVVLGNSSGTIELYNYLQGKTRTGKPWPVPLEFGGGYTKFPASGDYIRKTGFYDGVQYPPIDRRMMLCTGPFNMAPGDTQEVVFMELAAGADGVTKNLAAIELLKQSTLSLRNSYFGNGQTIFSTTVPEVKVTNLDGAVILNWGEDQTQINQIENSNSFYKFEGYNIYQFPKEDSKISDGKLIATFDVRNGITEIYSLDFDPSTQTLSQVIKAGGKNTGIKRHFQVTHDYINNKPLINWNEYYFGVSHYSYSFSNIFSNFHESNINIYKAFPKPLSPTTTPHFKMGDIIIADRIAGSSWRWFNGEVIDPYSLTDSEYEITFRIENNVPLFNIKNLTTGKTIFTNLAEPSAMNDFPLVEGVLPTFATSTTHPLTNLDIFRYKTYAPVTDQNLWIDEFDKINVFPNPFYGTTKNELFNNDQYVTFTYLPQRVVFRIFNLAGQLVSKFEKDSPERIFKWNLKNDNDMSISSGLYIVHIEFPDFGKVKILKIAIIQQ